MGYESEIGEPITTQCKCNNPAAEMKLHFDGWYLRLYVGGQVDSAQHARSGVANGNDPQNAFDYSVENQKRPNQGPIPEGEYWIQPNELRLPKFYDSDSHKRSWGNHRITIHHSRKTDTYGRGGFFIHGGAKFGSIGCIDLAGFIDHFVNRLRDLLPTVGGKKQEFSTSCYIPLTVKYPDRSVNMPPWFNK